MAEKKSKSPVLELEKIIQFDAPISVGDVQFHHASLREPTAGEMDDASAKDGLAWTIALVTSVSGLPLQVVRKFPIRVLNECAEYLVPFAESVRPTGQNG